MVGESNKRFIKRHFQVDTRSPEYGNEIWTPAMQAGLASKRMTFRQVFLDVNGSALFIFVNCLFKREDMDVRKEAV